MKAFYKAEFAKYGFTVGEEYKGQNSVRFNAPEYDGGLTCYETGSPARLYMIILTKK